MLNPLHRFSSDLCTFSPGKIWPTQLSSSCTVDEIVISWEQFGSRYLGFGFMFADLGLLMCLIHLAQYRSNQVWHSEPLIGSNVRTCHLMCRAPRAILYSRHLRDEAIIFGVLTRRMDGKIYLCLTYRRRHCRGNPGLCLGTHRGTAANITFCPWYLSGDCFDFWSESAIIA